MADSDYPDGAIRAGAQGRVVFALDVDTEGRVTACTIETSSGYPILDATTCRIMTARARFVPAQDRKGRPAVDRVHGAIRWVLPQPEQAAGRSNHATADLGALVSDFDYPDEAIRAGAQGIVKFILDVAVDGRVTACTIETSSGFPVLDQTTCQIMTARAQFVPAHDGAGRPVTDRLHAAIRWVLPPTEEEGDNQAMPPS